MVWDAPKCTPNFVLKLPESTEQIAAVSPRGDRVATWDTSQTMQALRLGQAGEEQPTVLAGQGKAISLPLPGRKFGARLSSHPGKLPPFCVTRAG